MHIHILGICGTFMGSMAVLAKELGHHVTGSDANVYPPMSTQLEAQGIELTQGYDPSQFDRYEDGDLAPSHSPSLLAPLSPAPYSPVPSSSHHLASHHSNLNLLSPTLPRAALFTLR